MFLLSGIPLIILGVSTLLALRQVYSVRRDVGDDTLVMVITLTGWVLVFAGVQMLASFFGMMVVLIIFAMTVAKFREGERRALLWTLGLAAGKGLPLAPSARAFAARRSDEMARRAWLLADSLESGIPLQDALKRSGNPLPVDATLMVRLGSDTNAQSIALRESAEGGGDTDAAWRPVFQQTLYLLAVILFCIFITAFIMIKIVPTFKEIFTDFDMELPASSQLMIQVANGFGTFWFLMVPPVAYLIVTMLIATFFYARGQIWIPWPLSWIFGRSQNPTILRGLAVCLEQNLPMDTALARLATEYPRLRDARRIRSAAHTVAHGGDWSESLLENEIVTQAEAAVLNSAARAGNLTWALREMAEIGNRRMAYRAKTLLSILTPMCLLTISIPVAMIAFGCFIPLISLIETLSFD